MARVRSISKAGLGRARTRPGAGARTLTQAKACSPRLEDKAMLKPMLNAKASGKGQGST